jgi:transcription initiation factor TFIID subunit 2
MSKQKRPQQQTSTASNRTFKVVHQKLVIKDVSFKRECMTGTTELTLQPLSGTGKIWKLNLNCKQCRVLHITVNDIFPASFSYADATLRITSVDSKRRNADFYDASLYEAVMSCDGDCVSGGGELIVRVPRDVYKDYPSFVIGDPPTVKVTIDFSLEKPSGGVQFVDCHNGQPSNYAHMFVYGWGNASRLWFPCIDSSSELCPWDISVTVPANMFALASGELTEQVLTADERRKTFYYTLTVPTSAPCIGLAIGPFEVFPDPILPELTYFCLPGLLPILKNTVSFVSGVFGYYEEFFSSRFPHTNCKLVFVDEAYQDVSAYSTLCICSTNLLHSHRVIDGVTQTRELIAEVLAKQYFGCYISSSSVHEWWLPLGIAKYVSHCSVKKMFGVTMSQYGLLQAERKVVEHELSKVIPPLYSTSYLNSPTSNGDTCVPMATPSAGTYPPSGRISIHPYFLSDSVVDVMVTRAFLIIHMIELRIGRDQLHQVFNKMLSLASTACDSISYGSWSNLLLSVSGLMKLVHTVSGKDITLMMEQWACRSGVPRMNVSYNFVRKKNLIEVLLKQEVPRGGAKFVGQLNISVQELDGFYTHTLQVEEISSSFELPCHSKIRKSKKRKVPLGCGEEVEMDLSQVDTEVPVLWINVDPEFQWIKEVEIEQADSTWQFVIKYERNALLQLKAVEALAQHPTPLTKTTLMEAVLNKNFFYIVKLKAAESLVKVLNSMASSGISSGPMISLYQRLYGSKTCPSILKYLDFSDLASYELQKFLPLCAAKTRAIHGQCTKDVLQFLMDVLKYSDNRLNKYVDGFHTAAVLDALGAFVTPSMSVIPSMTKEFSLTTLSEDLQLLLKEVIQRLNLEKVLPSHQFAVTISCISVLRTLQKNGHLPNNAALFRDYAVLGHYVNVRLAAIKALVDLLQETQSELELDFLLKIAESDPVPLVRMKVLDYLSETPPFTRKKDSILNTVNLVERLWSTMSQLSHDPRLRNSFVALYSSLYGRLTPTCMPQGLGIVIDLKEQVARASLGSPVAAQLSEDIPLPGPTTSGLYSVSIMYPYCC